MHVLFVLLLLGTYSEVESICTILYGKTTKTLLLYIGGLHVECHIYNYMMKTRLISTTIIIALNAIKLTCGKFCIIINVI